MAQRTLLVLALLLMRATSRPQPVPTAVATTLVDVSARGPPLVAGVRSGRPHARATLRAPHDTTDVRLWPAPVSESHVPGGVKWQQVGGANEAAMSDDCPFMSRGPSSSLRVCEAACAEVQECNFVNFNPTLPDCVFRACVDPLHANMTPNDGYSGYGTLSSSPRSFAINPNTFTLTATHYTDSLLEDAMVRYAELFFADGARVSARTSGGSSHHASSAPPLSPINGLRVEVGGHSTLGLSTNETYTLSIGGDASGWATLTSATVYGAMRGLETFSQLLALNLTTGAYSIATTEVVDYPRFPYRAVMLDTSRHFLSLGALRQVMDAMSYLKLNVLHLHLTDDNSWPVEIAAWPRLASTGAFSNYTQHIYSPSDIAALVAYGAARGIRLIAEFDTPAHFSVLFAAYPEFAAVSIDPKTNETYLCLVDPSREETFTFLESVWTEIAAMFPDEAIHIGGDEFWGCWSDSPAVSAWMNASNYTLSDAYHYYERRVIGIARKLGKRAIAWLDIAGYPQDYAGNYTAYPDVTLDVWTGCYSGDWQDDVSTFTKANASVVVSGPYYITQQQDEVGPHFSWQQMYRTDLYNFTGNTSAALALVHGGELCAWDDAAQTDSGDIVVSLSPFMVAVAEAWWSPQAVTSSVAPDEERAHVHRCRMGARGIPSHPMYAFGSYCTWEYEPSVGHGAAGGVGAAAQHTG